MQDKMYNNEFVNSKENITKNDETLNSEKELVLTNEPEVEEYKRVDVDGGILNNDADIEYFKAIQYNDIIDNCLLGDFDSKGNYVVNPVIVEQLLKMKKVFVSAFEKSVFVESLREFDGYGKINFRLKWTNNSQGQKVVVLELLENITRVNGYFENTNHIALLGVAINDDTSTEAVYKYFNVIQKADNDDDGAEKEDNRDIIDVINRIAYFQIAKVGQRKFMAKYYKDAYDKKIALLSSNKRGAYLLEDFNKEYLYCNNKFFKEGDVEYYKYLNQLIDAIIERNIDFIRDDKDLLQALRNLNKQSANVFRTTNDMVLNATNQKANEIKHKANTLNKQSEQEQVEVKPQQKVQDTPKTETPKSSSSSSGSKKSKNDDFIYAGASKGNQPHKHHQDNLPKENDKNKTNDKSLNLNEKLKQKQEEIYEDIGNKKVENALAKALSGKQAEINKATEELKEDKKIVSIENNQNKVNANEYESNLGKDTDELEKEIDNMDSIVLTNSDKSENQEKVFENTNEINQEPEINEEENLNIDM